MATALSLSVLGLGLARTRAFKFKTDCDVYSRQLSDHPTLEALRIKKYHDSPWLAVFASIGIAYRHYRSWLFSQRHPTVDFETISKSAVSGMEEFGSFGDERGKDASPVWFLFEARLLLSCAKWIILGNSVHYEIGFRWYNFTSYGPKFKESYLNFLDVEPVDIQASFSDDVSDSPSVTEIPATEQVLSLDGSTGFRSVSESISTICVAIDSGFDPTTDKAEAIFTVPREFAHCLTQTGLSKGEIRIFAEPWMLQRPDSSLYLTDHIFQETLEDSCVAFSDRVAEASASCKLAWSKGEPFLMLPSSQAALQPARIRDYPPGLQAAVFLAVKDRPPWWRSLLLRESFRSWMSLDI